MMNTSQAEKGESKDYIGEVILGQLMKGLKITKTDKQETLKKRNRRNIPEEESKDFHGSLNGLQSRI